MNPSDFLFLCALLGVALGFALPSGVKPGTKYERPTEADFQELLRRNGLK